MINESSRANQEALGIIVNKPSRAKQDALGIIVKQPPRTKREALGHFFKVNQNFMQRLRLNHFRYRFTLKIEYRGATFSISSRWRLRNRTKSKIFGFSKIAQRISMKIKLRGHFSILFKLRISKARK